MSKKHYIAIAAILRAHENREEIARELARYFASLRSEFDRARFLAACGVGE